MNYRQQLAQQPNVAMRVLYFLTKPFQITKVLELLYMLDWIWYALISFIPDKYISGSLFEILRSIPYLAPYGIRILLTGIALLHFIGLTYNYILLRRINLIFNIAVLLYITSRAIIAQPLSSGIGYIVILLGITIFAFWRMDESS